MSQRRWISSRLRICGGCDFAYSNCTRCADGRTALRPDAQTDPCVTTSSYLPACGTSMLKTFLLRNPTVECTDSASGSRSMRVSGPSSDTAPLRRRTQRRSRCRCRCHHLQGLYQDHSRTTTSCDRTFSLHSLAFLHVVDTEASQSVLLMFCKLVPTTPSGFASSLRARLERRRSVRCVKDSLRRHGQTYAGSARRTRTLLADLCQSIR